jgi:DNA-binding GntR family transcriptional regulator
VVMEHKSLKPLDTPAPLRQQVYERLEELIIYGALEPGEHLVESRLAQRLGVSRIPVREALQLLHRDGWVDLRPRQGAFVHQPTVQEVDEVFGVRTLLEVESARLAAKAAKKDSLQELRKMLNAGTRALSTNDGKELVRLNSAFHARVTELGGNHVLAEVIARLDKRIRWYFAPVVTLRGRTSWEEHTELVEAVEAGDPERAAEVMRTHAEGTKSAYHLWKEQDSAAQA